MHLNLYHAVYFCVCVGCHLKCHKEHADGKDSAAMQPCVGGEEIHLSLTIPFVLTTPAFYIARVSPLFAYPLSFQLLPLCPFQKTCLFLLVFVLFYVVVVVVCLIFSYHPFCINFHL